jgi:thiamine pyrophosphokinase
MKCAVVCNGVIEYYEWLKEELGGYNTVIAVNGGVAHCRRVGIVPALVIGDMDSFAGTVESRTIQHPSEKDYSDMEIAVKYALQEGFSEADVFGALGGRIDHELCNIMVCGRYPGSIRLVDRDVEIVALTDGQERDFAGNTGDTVTLMPLEKTVRCATAGLAYPLNDEDLERGSRGLSNVMEGDACSVSVSRGTLIIIHLKGE